MMAARCIGAAATLLALAACGSGAEKAASHEAKAEQAGSASAPSEPVTATPAPSPTPAVNPESAPARPAKAAETARRCGWLHNPTPGNWWLTDRAGEWILAAQGGRQAEGMDALPDMSGPGWQEVNGHYGYGCACLTLTADPATREVAAVADPQPKPLAVCRADRSLPTP